MWIDKALGGARRVGVDGRGVHGEGVGVDVGREVAVGRNGRRRDDGVRWRYMVGGMGGVRDMMVMMVALMVMVGVLSVAEGAGGAMRQAKVAAARARLGGGRGLRGLGQGGARGGVDERGGRRGESVVGVGRGRGGSRGGRRSRRGRRRAVAAHGELEQALHRAEQSKAKQSKTGRRRRAVTEERLWAARRVLAAMCVRTRPKVKSSGIKCKLKFN